MTGPPPRRSRAAPSDGVVGGDVVACTGTATFDTASVGTGKTVTATGLTLTGAGASNYTLTSTTATTTAAITALTVTPVVTAANKDLRRHDSGDAHRAARSPVRSAATSWHARARRASQTLPSGAERPSRQRLDADGRGGGKLRPVVHDSDDDSLDHGADRDAVRDGGEQALRPDDAATLTSCTVTGAVGGDVVACTRHGDLRHGECRHGQDRHGERPDADGRRGRELRALLDHRDDDGGDHRGRRSRRPSRRRTRSYNGTTAATLTSCTVTGRSAATWWRAPARRAFDTAAVGAGKTVTATGLTLTGAAAGQLRPRRRRRRRRRRRLRRRRSRRSSTRGEQGVRRDDGRDAHELHGDGRRGRRCGGVHGHAPRSTPRASARARR